MGRLRRLLHRLATPRRARCPLCGEGVGTRLPEHLTWAHTPMELRAYVQEAER